MARRRHIEEHENHERWLVSYADFITLLFAFFVVMYAVSSVNEGKMRVLSDSLVATFSSREKSLNPIQVGKLVRSAVTDDVSPVTKPIVAPPTPLVSGASGRERSTTQGAPEEPSQGRTEFPDAAAQPAGAPGDGDGDGAGQGRDGGPMAGDGAGKGRDGGRMAGVDTVADKVEAAMSRLIDEGQVYVRRKDTWLEIEFKSSILFDSGEARLASNAIPALERLSEILREFPNPIQVEGFTDNVPISTGMFPSNWELSASRAASVVHLLARYGVHPERMAAIGYGEYRPIAGNDTPQGRGQNRRVVLVIPTVSDARRALELQRLMGESSASGPNTVEPWADAPAKAM